MNQQRTTAIVLTRINYGEADRIITMLTPDSGKLSLMAKGVRKVKSKLAGGIELFSTSEISYLPGRGSVSTLISARLIRHYPHIVQNIDRTLLCYELLQLLHKVTEDNPEREYFELLQSTFEALDDTAVPAELIRVWFLSRLLALGGHAPNLRTTAVGEKLSPNNRYEFDFDATAMTLRTDGVYGVSEIKLLRLLFAQDSVLQLAKVSEIEALTKRCLPLVTMLRQLHLSA